MRKKEHTLHTYKHTKTGLTGMQAVWEKSLTHTEDVD